MSQINENSKLLWAKSFAEGAQPDKQVLTLSDGYETSGYVYRPCSAPPRLPVVYLHGIQSHCGWFGGSASHLASCGHEVWQVTRRGNGQNAAHRGHASSPRQLIDDVEVACQAAAGANAGKPVHLVGVSWGGKLAACYAASRDRKVELASVTLIAPGIVPRVGVSWPVKLAIAVSLLCCPRRRFEVPLSDVALFTDNEQMREYLRADTHRLHHATASFLFASELLSRQLSKAPCACLDMPTTLILAGRDRIIDNARTERTVRRLAAEQLNVERLEGCHTLEFEPDPTKFYDVLAAALGRGEPV